MCSNRALQDAESTWFETEEADWTLLGEVNRAAYWYKPEECKIAQGPTPGGSKDGKPVY